MGSSSFLDPSTGLSKLRLLHKLGGGIKAVSSNGVKSSELTTTSSNCLVAIVVATAKKPILIDIGGGGGAEPLKHPKADKKECDESCLPSETPRGLKKLMEEELNNLQGNGKCEKKSNNRIYDYEK